MHFSFLIIWKDLRQLLLVLVISAPQQKKAKKQNKKRKKIQPYDRKFAVKQYIKPF